MKDIILSLAQMRSAVGNLQGNFDRIRHLTESVKDNSDIICFPEACLTGYETRDPEPFCISLEDAAISDMSRLSKECGINIVFGFIERNGGSLHVTQALSDISGKMHIYRKTHLGRQERKRFVPGDTIPTFELPEATLGIQLCWESHFPGISAKMREKGADITLISYASPLSPSNRREIWMKHLPARAYDNGIFVAAVNATGDNGNGMVFGGGIMVFDPKGNVICEHFGKDDFVATVKLSSSLRNSLGSDDEMGRTDYFIYRRNDLY